MFHVICRTPPLTDEDRISEPCATLARHLPTQAHALFFGGTDAIASKSVATQVQAERKVPAISIYVISTNAEHESALNYLFRDVAVRMVKIKNSDFYTKEQGLYEGMGADRCGALFGAEKLYKAPCMVMDAGTAWTYTALDRSHKVLGGGISPGLYARFRSMSDYCGDLPLIDYDKYNSRFKQAIDGNETIPVFATDTESGMLVASLSEIGNQSRSLVKHFIDKVGKGNPKSSIGDDTEMATDEKKAGEAKDDGEDDTTRKPNVVLTGGDALFLSHVLQRSDSKMLGCEPGSSLPKENYNVYVMKHLIHYGVGQMLATKTDRKKEHPDDDLREKLLGLRVAKEFPTPDEDGDNWYRGSIISVSRESSLEDDLFYVRYDDGDAEHLELREIYRKFPKTKIRLFRVLRRTNADILFCTPLPVFFTASNCSYSYAGSIY